MLTQLPEEMVQNTDSGHCSEKPEDLSNIYSLNMSGSETASDTTSDTSLPQTYQMKTMCLAKKAVQMPSKEEHGFLLFCGLGARKWEVDMNCNSLTFKQAILNIYPRLRSVIGYNLYTVSRDKKQFERIPERANTPKRIRSYLGPAFTGCLIIVPVSDIVLMEEKREHLRQIDVRQTELPAKTTIANEPTEPPSRQRSLCLICGKCEKTPGTGSFYKIFEETIECYGGRGDLIAKRLTEMLGFNFETKRKFLASIEICKKCLRTTTEVVRMEEQVKRSKEELVSNFFTTISKFKKSNGSHNEESRPSPPAQNPAPQVNGLPYPTFSPTTAGFPPVPVVNNGCTPFLVQPMPLSFINQHKNLHYNNGIVKFYQSQPYSTIRHSNEINMPTEKEENLPEALPSENGSSCYMSVSPLPKTKQTRDELEEDSCYSPRPFDTQSYASTFSFRSTSSIRSKAEIKSYDEPISLEIESKDQTNKNEQPEKRKCESNDTSPRSQTSPISTSSPKPDSLASESPSRTPDLDKEKEDESERMKPWKKRKIAKESGESQGEKSPESVGVKENKTSEGDESPDCRQQCDQSNSDN